MSTVGNSFEASKRIYGFDIWRAVLLVFGPLVHSAMIIRSKDCGQYYGIEFASGIFRMEAFFGISGVASLFSYKKLGGGRHFILRRFLNLIIPMVTVFITIMPIWWRSVGETVYNVNNIDHLWFLPELFVSTVMIYLIENIGIMSIIVQKLQNSNIMALLFVFTITSAIGRFLCRESFCVFGDNFNIIFGHNLPVIFRTILGSVYFGQFYLLGWLVGSSTILRQKIIDTHLVIPAALIVYSGFLVAFMLFPSIWIPNSSQLVWIKIFVAGAPALPALLITVAIMKTSIKFNKKPYRWIENLREVSFSVYLFHFPIIGITWVICAGMPNLLKFCVCVVSSFFGSILLHILLVRRSRWGAFLFNGRIPPSLMLRM